MGLDTIEAPKANGLKTALDIIVAPGEALASLKLVPTWGWACLIATVLLLGGYAMQRPAQLHAAVGTVQHMVATNSMFAGMTDEQKQKIVENAQHPPAFQAVIGVIGGVFTLFAAVLLNAVILLLASMVGSGSAGFRQLWAGSMNVAIPTFGLNYVVLGAICIALGPDHFATSMDLFRAVPGPAMLLPAQGLLGGILMGLNVFMLWGCVLNIMMMRTVAGVKGAISWIAPVLILLGGALIIGGSSSFYGG